jgi:hypothetical protein
MRNVKIAVRHRLYSNLVLLEPHSVGQGKANATALRTRPRGWPLIWYLQVHKNSLAYNAFFQVK